MAVQTKTIGKTFVERIASTATKRYKKYSAGDYIEIVPNYVMTHDNTYAIIKKFERAGLSCIAYPERLKFIMDHDVQNMSKDNQDKYKYIKDFANNYNIEYFPPTTGIGHQVMCEQGYIIPNTFVVASDSHSNMYGGLGCLGTPVVRTDAVDLWATGKTWWQIPETILVRFSGKLPFGVYAKDIILTLINRYPNLPNNLAVEFAGYEDLSISDRMTIANMTTEWGAVAGVFPADNKTIKWLFDNQNFIRKQLDKYDREDGECYNMLFANMNNISIVNRLERKTANYYAIIELDLSSLSPIITGPNDVSKKVCYTEIENITKIRIDKGYILSCVNGRLEDLRLASDVIKGNRLKRDLYIAAASKYIEDRAREYGYWDIFRAAGAKFLPSGCGPCIGLGAGILEDGEVAISATNRNYKGRMGSKNATCYLANPAIVAKSCIDGYITVPKKSDIITSVVYNKDETTYQYSEPSTNALLENITAHVIIINEENISTDLIYAGKYTYKELSLEQQAKVIFENYETTINFPEKFILVAGNNFGTGSSREQAVTALKARGCVAVIAPSFNHTYLRNALNNGLICIKSITFLNDILEESKFIQYNSEANIDFKTNQIYYNNSSCKFEPINEFGQKLLLSKIK